MAKTALFVAGGTGGHIFPARATADELVSRGWTVQLITDARGARHAGDFPGGPLIQIEASSPFQKNPLKLVRALLQLARGYGQSRKAIKELQPDVVVGFGGYPAFPVLAAARTTSLPYLIHEQNAVLGRVNRVFSGSAAHVASGFSRLDKLKDTSRQSVVGNPVRRPILSALETSYAGPSDDGPIEILVIGGSLGARLLSLTVPKAIALLPEDLRQRLHVVQQTRDETLDEVRTIYAQAGVKADLASFFDDMGALYGQSHLVISRAGASSVSEIATVGRPAIFVPLGIAMDDHQTANAEGLARNGSAEVISEADFTAERLSQCLETALRDGDGLRQRAQAARMLACENAAERLADLIASTAE